MSKLSLQNYFYVVMAREDHLLELSDADIVL